MTRDRLLLLDVGGTFIKCSDGRVIPVNSDGSREEVSASFREAVAAFCSEALSHPELRYGIALAITGPFDYVKGIFRMKHKYASVEGEDFRVLAGVPDCVELRYTHDVNGMLSGEMSFGNGRGYSRVALVTLGTGLGFSMSLDGEIIRNDMGSPRVSIFRLPCRDGILEDYVSKRGILSIFASFGGKAYTVKEVAALATAGDWAAQESFSEAASLLSSALYPIISGYGIECLLFGGQISRSFEFMEDALRRGLAGLDCLRHIGPVSDFDNATFNGLRSIFEL